MLVLLREGPYSCLARLADRHFDRDRLFLAFFLMFFLIAAVIAALGIGGCACGAPSAGYTGRAARR